MLIWKNFHKYFSHEIYKIETVTPFINISMKCTNDENFHAYTTLNIIIISLTLLPQSLLYFLYVLEKFSVTLFVYLRNSKTILLSYVMTFFTWKVIIYIK